METTPHDVLVYAVSDEVRSEVPREREGQAIDAIAALGLPDALPAKPQSMIDMVDFDMSLAAPCAVSDTESVAKVCVPQFCDSSEMSESGRNVLRKRIGRRGAPNRRDHRQTSGNCMAGSGQKTSDSTI